MNDLSLEIFKSWKPALSITKSFFNLSLSNFPNSLNSEGKTWFPFIWKDELKADNIFSDKISVYQLQLLHPSVLLKNRKRKVKYFEPGCMSYWTIWTPQPRPSFSFPKDQDHIPRQATSCQRNKHSILSPGISSSNEQQRSRNKDTFWTVIKTMSLIWAIYYYIHTYLINSHKRDTLNDHLDQTWDNHSLITK